MDSMESLARTESEEWSIVDGLYPQLRRFAAVSAPFDMDPDDLLQEALVNVLSKRPLSELEHPGAYLRRTILNVAASHSRRGGTRRRAMRRHAASADLTSPATYPSDLADLYRLPPRERATLYLFEVEGYHFDEIARMLGCSEAAAKKGASRARRRLAEALGAEGNA
jgi:DNA-directed RNA polymerase specialized sigma24 family protein